MPLIDVTQRLRKSIDTAVASGTNREMREKMVRPDFVDKLIGCFKELERYVEEWI